jgi:hypothetical protein
MATLKMIYGFHKHAWAKITVTTTLKRVYLENNKFSPSELEVLEDMISSVNSKASQQVSKFKLLITCRDYYWKRDTRLKDQVRPAKGEPHCGGWQIGACYIRKWTKQVG